MAAKTTRASPSGAERGSHRGPRQGGEGGRRGWARGGGRLLGGEVEAQAKSEEAVRRADDAEVGGAGREHARVIAEQSEPRLRPGRSGKADRLGHAECKRAAGERDAQRALVLPGPDEIGRA